MILDGIDEPVRRLAMVVSIAARIEPELLRAARLRLLPDVGAAAEADLWFSELAAARSTRRMVLDADAAAALRTTLANDRPLLDRARRVIAEVHAAAPPAIQIEEEITYLALAGGDVEPAIEAKLTSVLNAIATEGRTGLIDWAARALPRMPALVQKTAAAAALLERAVPKTEVYARLIADASGGFEVEIGREALPAAHRIALPKTEPLVLELTTANQSDVVEVPRERTLIRRIVENVSIRTMAHEVFRLAPETGQRAIRLLAGRNIRPEDMGQFDAVMIERGPEWDIGPPVFAISEGAFARTLLVEEKRIGIARIVTGGDDLPEGRFLPAELARVCGGDLVAWSRAHDVAILLMHHGPGQLDADSKARWSAYGADFFFDLIFCGSTSEVALPVAGVQGSTPLEVILSRSGSSMNITICHLRGDTLSHVSKAARDPIVLAPEKMPSRRVLVAGLGQGLSMETQELSRTIGTMLALHGHDLFTGGWPGVDYLAAEGFDQAAPRRAERSIYHYLSDRKEPDYPRGQKIHEAWERSIREADVVVLIDGASGTYDIGKAALSEGKPVIPLGGGAAAGLREAALEAAPLDFRDRLRQLDRGATIAATVSIVRELIALAAPPQSSTGDQPQRKKIFISAAHADRRLVEEFRKTVGPLLPNFELWAEDGKPGDNFDSFFEARKEAIERSSVAVIFLTPEYLASEFRRSDLARLIHDFQERHLIATWFLGSASPYQETPLREIAAAHSVSKPLDELGIAQRRAIYTRFAANLLRDWSEAPERVLEVYYAALRDADKQPAQETSLTWRSLAAYFRTIGNHQDAIEAYEKALSGFRAVADRPEEGSTLLALGEVYEEIGNIARATAMYREALRRFEELGMRDAAEAARERLSRLMPA